MQNKRGNQEPPERHAQERQAGYQRRLPQLRNIRVPHRQSLARPSSLPTIPLTVYRAPSNRASAADACTFSAAIGEFRHRADSTDILSDLIEIPSSERSEARASDYSKPHADFSAPDRIRPLAILIHPDCNDFWLDGFLPLPHLQRYPSGSLACGLFSRKACRP